MVPVLVVTVRAVALMRCARPWPVSAPFFMAPPGVGTFMVPPGMGIPMIPPGMGILP
jgi:hypothetical protein